MNNFNDFFDKKRGWISQLYDSNGNHTGTRQFLFNNEAHLVITTYDTDDQLLSSEHVFPIHQGPQLPYEQIMQLTKKLAEQQSSKKFETDKSKIIL
jgi:hypothetical protein